MNPVWHFVNGVPTGGVIAPSVLLVGDGTAAAPSIARASATGTGFNFSGGNLEYGKAGAVVFFVAPGIFQLYGSTASVQFGDAADVSLSRGAADVLTTPDRFVSTGPVAGIGYGTGAGGTVTQLTSKATGVSLSTVTGEITLNNAALAAATVVSFVLTNTAIAAGDTVLVQHVSAGTVGAYTCTAVAAAGSATIYVRNASAGSLSEAIVLKFNVWKSVTS